MYNPYGNLQQQPTGFINNANSYYNQQQPQQQQPQQQQPQQQPPQQQPFNGNVYGQQPPSQPLNQLINPPTTDFGNFQANLPNNTNSSPANYSALQQQPQTGFNYQPTGFNVQQPTGLNQQQTGITQQQTGFNPQQTGFPSTSFNTGTPQLQPPSTSFNSGFDLKPQTTGFYSQVNTGPLKPQQTGFYTQPVGQQQQTPLMPLKPTATGFVNSFANNGLNTELKIPNRRLSFITMEDQAKFETLFRSKVPIGSNTISGDECRDILMKSGLQPQQLARIWALSDTDKAGELLFPQFALAMYLVNSALQGEPLPFDLDSKTKNEVSSFIDAINLSITSGNNDASNLPKTPFDALLGNNIVLQPQPTGLMPTTSFGAMASQATGGLQPQTTGYMPQTSFGMMAPQATGGGLQPQTTGMMASQVTGGLQMQNTGLVPQTSFGMMAPQITGGLQAQNNTGLMPQTTGGLQAQNTGLLPQMTGGLQAQNTGLMPQTSFGMMAPQATGGGLYPQNTGIMNPPQTSFGGLSSQMTGNAQPLRPQATGFGLRAQPTGMLPVSNFNPTAPLTAQKTGFGNNELYSTNNFSSNFVADNDDFITPEEKSLFYKIFDTYDNAKTGLMDSPTAVEIFRKSGLNRSDLEHIWNLADSDNTGTLNRQEFAVGMHLVYRRLNGYVLPNSLPRSLVPESTKIIDSVKNQLKAGAFDNIAKKQATSLNGANFKNEDELPQFRSRRKTADDTKQPVEIKKSANVSSSLDTEEFDRQELTELKKLVHEKKILIEAEKSRAESKKSGVETRKLNDLREIEKLKQEISSLPTPASSSISVDLSSRFEKLNSRVSQLLNDITSVENEITATKIELYKKKNPSSVIGTGPNGEITDYDRKKAKRKALLAERMATLTGKPVAKSADLEEEEAKLNKEIQKINTESKINLSIVTDIKTSIDEIATGVRKSLFGEGLDASEKWNSGVGLEPEVKQFIEMLKTQKLKANYFAQVDSKESSTSHTAVSTPVSASSTGSITSSQEASYSQFKTPEERASYIKEQAKKRMNERLAKLGISRRTESTPTVDTGVVNRSKAEHTPLTTSQPTSAEVRVERHSKIENVPLATPQPDLTHNVFSSPEKVTKPAQESVNEDEDEDEEERQLKAELAALKMKKKQEKEQRLAMLRKQLEDAKNEDYETEPVNSSVPSGSSGMAGNNNYSAAAPNHSSIPAVVKDNGDDDDWDDTTAIKPVAPINTNQGHVVYSNNNNTNNALNQPLYNNSPIGNTAGPISQQSTNSSLYTSATNVTGARTPYFQQPNTSLSHLSNGSHFDPKAAETQRRLQRGLDDNEDDGWSDDDGNNDANGDHVQQQQQQQQQQTNGSAVPIAPPLPSVDNNVSSAPTVPVVHSLPQVPVVTPLPQVTSSETISAPPPVPVAPPLPQVTSSGAIPAPPPVPVAPPLPQVNNSNVEPVVAAAPPSLSNSQNFNAEDDENDLSIPESVSSDDDNQTSMSMPPPPPLPSF
ncbi:uncharacterized protein SCODWIG_01194 [Saccharomycodes ludwigii]|uniref:Actin cytoskeleton-regulatory complex protein PAN1 n=1 Tax=Saccharomycodes ludwigii TaxID=36035 RepID=A0A376B429_9ASCO|nr:uncharacterized protein SCODWIG_01194 [Saccharomycodes ludwigii]